MFSVGPVRKHLLNKRPWEVTVCLWQDLKHEEQYVRHNYRRIYWHPWLWILCIPTISELMGHCYIVFIHLCWDIQWLYKKSERGLIPYRVQRWVKTSNTAFKTCGEKKHKHTSKEDDIKQRGTFYHLKQLTHQADMWQHFHSCGVWFQVNPHQIVDGYFRTISCQMFHYVQWPFAHFVWYQRGILELHYWKISSCCDRQCNW